MKHPSRSCWRHRFCRGLVALAAVTQALAADGAAVPRKKFIELGWDIPSTTVLREHWREMEQTTPFDGVEAAVFKNLLPAATERVYTGHFTINADGGGFGNDTTSPIIA
jgi:hypothetical protein